MRKLKVALNVLFYCVIAYGCKATQQVPKETLDAFNTFKINYNKTYGDKKKVTLT